MDIHDRQHREILRDIACRAMLERELLPDFAAAALAEVQGLRSSGASMGGQGRDLTALAWASLDNHDSKDLDQLTVAEVLPGGRARILVAVADVDALVRDGSAIDGHARHNTTTVYTPAQVFPMLPEELSTDMTSLNPGEERPAVVTEMVVGEDGEIEGSDVYEAKVRSRAKLAYETLGAWLVGEGPAPEAVASVDGLAETLRLQDRAARAMRDLRRARGALDLQTIEARPVFEGDTVCELRAEGRNRAKDIIQDLMIAANGVAARYLSAVGYPVIRRVVRSPRRWNRIVQLAAEQGQLLPEEPDARALEAFLALEKREDPLRFPDLSLSVIKLLGPGEYVAEPPGEDPPGHFGLAAKDYVHSTAPNRRYVDLITQRLLKAALGKRPWPYTVEELGVLAEHCTRQENAVNKVERTALKAAAALLLESRIGEEFDALVTGAATKGTWVRLLTVPVEGRLTDGFPEVDVGDCLRVRLLSVDAERGFIDFARASARAKGVSSRRGRPLRGA